MLTTSSLSALAASAIGFGLVGTAGDTPVKPSPDRQPVTIEQPTLVPNNVLQDPSLDRAISVDFKEASITEVLNWLAENGVNFVADTGSVNQKSKLTMHITNRPVREVLEAVATTFGGKWEKRGSTYAFVSGTDNPLLRVERIQELDKMPKISVPMEGLDKLHDLIPPLPFQMDGKEMKIDPKHMQEFEMRMKAWAEKFAKQFGEDGKARVFMMPPDSIKEFKMDSKSAAELEKHMKELHEKLGKELGKDGRVFQFKLDEKSLSELKEELKNMPKIDKEQMDKLREEMGKMHAIPFDGKQMPRDAIKIGGGDIRELMKSLTPAQWAKHEKQGYLTPADLSAPQRKIIGDLPNSSVFSITVMVDGKKLTIKNK